MRYGAMVLGAMAFAVVMSMTVDSGAAEKKHQVTIDDVMSFKFIDSAELTATGDILLRIQGLGANDKFVKDFYLLSPSGNVRQITFGGRMKGDFALSPDGKSVAWYGEREGKSGIFLLPLDGGESRLVVELPLSASALRWSGNNLYFSAPVFPDCGVDFDCTVGRLNQKAQQTSAMTYDDLYMRPWNTWWDGTRNNLFVYDMVGGGIQAVATGDFDIPTIPWGGVEDYAISADGKAVCYTAKKVEKKYRSTNTDLFEVVNGNTVQITTNKGADHSPKYSPDGRFIAFLSQDVENYESDRVRLKVYDRKRQEVISLTETVDDWVMEFVWMADSSGLYATVAREGHRVLYQVSLNKRVGASAVFQRGMYRHLFLSRDGSQLLFTNETMTTPPELFTMNLKDGKSVKLTSLNDDALKNILMPTVEEIRWEGSTSSSGRKRNVHGFLVRPVDDSGKVIKKKVPLVVMVHGGPQGAWENSLHPRWTPLGLTASGYAVAMPNITGSFGYGQDFVVDVSGDWGGRPYEDVMTMVEHLSRDSSIDGQRVCAMGGSYGGYMANWLEAKSGDRFKCLVSHAGPADLRIMYGTTDELWFPEWEMRGTPWDFPDEVQKWSPLSYVVDFKTPMLVIHGANDFRVPLEQALGMFTALKRRDIDARLVVFPDEDHFISTPRNRRFWYGTVNEWLDRYLGK